MRPPHTVKYLVPHTILHFISTGGLRNINEFSCNLIHLIIHPLVFILYTVENMAISRLRLVTISVREAVAIHSSTIAMKSHSAVSVLNSSLSPTPKLILVDVFLQSGIFPAHELSALLKQGGIVTLGTKWLLVGIGEDVEHLGRSENVWFVGGLMRIGEV